MLNKLEPGLCKVHAVFITFGFRTEQRTVRKIHGTRMTFVAFALLLPVVKIKLKLKISCWLCKKNMKTKENVSQNWSSVYAKKQTNKKNPHITACLWFSCLCIYLRFFRRDAGSLASRVLTKPNSCMTRSSCLRSSWPFNRNMNSWPLLPAEMEPGNILLIRCSKRITD